MPLLAPSPRAIKAVPATDAISSCCDPLDSPPNVSGTSACSSRPRPAYTAVDLERCISSGAAYRAADLAHEETPFPVPLGPPPVSLTGTLLTASPPVGPANASVYNFCPSSVSWMSITYDALPSRSVTSCTSSPGRISTSAQTALRFSLPRPRPLHLRSRTNGATIASITCWVRRNSGIPTKPIAISTFRGGRSLLVPSDHTAHRHWTTPPAHRVSLKSSFSVTFPNTPNSRSTMFSYGAHKVIEKLNHTPLNGKPLRIMLSCRDPDARRSGIGNLFVKNLVDSIDNMKLHEIFMEFGTILSCKVATNYDGKSRGYGFVQFDTQESADSAIEKINGSSIGGKQIYVGHFIKKSERLLASPDVQYTNLYMKNLDEDITEELLRLKFSEFGKITNMAIAKDSEGKSKGFAFINFENHEDAKQAMEAMNGLQLGSEALYVARAQKKAERQQFLCRLFEERRNERIRKNVSNVYVKNIDDSVDNTVLRDHFSTCGTITSAKIMRNEKGISKGYGFVCFSTPEEANDAVRTLHGYMFHGKPLYAAIAQRKEERKAQLQMQFAQRMAGLAGSSSAIFPPGYPLYYGTPSGLMPPISSRHGFMYPPLAVRPGWRPSGITIPARPNFPQILPAVISNMPRQQRQRGRTSGHVLPFPNQSMPCDPHLQQANNVNSSKEYSSQQAKYVPNGRAAELNNGPFHPVDANGQSAEILSSMLASVSSKQQKQMLGEQLFPRVQELEANLASKVTGMLLEMDNSELLVLLDCPESLAAKVDEAVQVLKLSGTNKVEQEQQQQEVRKPMIHHPITGPPRLLSIDQLPKEK